MRTSALAIVVVVLMLAACGLQQGSRPVGVDESAPPAIASACELAGRRCSRCHAIERVERSRLSSATQWRAQVRRMRLMPSSGIPPEEELPIVQCLVFRTAGQAGLDALMWTVSP